MANKRIRTSFDWHGGEISELNAFRVYQAHIKTGKPESLVQISGVVYRVVNRGVSQSEALDGEHGYVEITIKRPDDVIQID